MESDQVPYFLRHCLRCT